MKPLLASKACWGVVRGSGPPGPVHEQPQRSQNRDLTGTLNWIQIFQNDYEGKRQRGGPEEVAAIQTQVRDARQSPHRRNLRELGGAKLRKLPGAHESAASGRYSPQHTALA